MGNLYFHHLKHVQRPLPRGCSLSLVYQVSWRVFAQRSGNVGSDCFPIPSPPLRPVISLSLVIRDLDINIVPTIICDVSIRGGFSVTRDQGPPTAEIWERWSGHNTLFISHYPTNEMIQSEKAENVRKTN